MNGVGWDFATIIEGTGMKEWGCQDAVNRKPTEREKVRDSVSNQQCPTRREQTVRGDDEPLSANKPEGLTERTDD